MNADEMLCLASIQRYHTTALVFLGGGSVILFEGLQQKLTGSKAAITAAVFCLILALTSYFGGAQYSTLYSRAPYHNDETQGEWLALKQQYGLTDGSRYLVYTRGAEVDTWTMRYVARYVLCSDTVDFWQRPEEEYTWQELYDNYDYLILYAPDDASRAFLTEGGFDENAGFVHLMIG